jgi:F0F1-type ATP synthase assembly protein I
MRRVPTDPHAKDSQNDAPAPRPGEARQKTLAYQGAIEAVTSIMIGGALGYFADDRFDTSPYLLLLGFALGFGACFVRLSRLRRVMEASEHPPDRPE